MSRPECAAHPKVGSVCRIHGNPSLLNGQCPYCMEALDILGEFADWMDGGGAR